MLRDLYRDAEHLFRVVLLCVVGVLVFLVARAVAVPKGFGEYGHYRAPAIRDAAAKTPVFAGQAACAECHDDVLATKAAGAHRGVHCEACHGPLSAHAADPSAVEVALPDGRALCVTCHEQNASRPASFPQVVPSEHAGDDVCTECHVPHAPSVQ